MDFVHREMVVEEENHTEPHLYHIYICVCGTPLEYSGFRSSIDMVAAKMHVKCTFQLLKKMLKKTLFDRPKFPTQDVLARASISWIEDWRLEIIAKLLLRVLKTRLRGIQDVVAHASTSWIEDWRLKIISQLFLGFLNLQSEIQDVLAHITLTKV